MSIKAKIQPVCSKSNRNLSNSWMQPKPPLSKGGGSPWKGDSEGFCTLQHRYSVKVSANSYCLHESPRIAWKAIRPPLTRGSLVRQTVRETSIWLYFNSRRRSRHCHHSPFTIRHSPLSTAIHHFPPSFTIPLCPSARGRWFFRPFDVGWKRFNLGRKRFHPCDFWHFCKELVVSLQQNY